MRILFFLVTAVVLYLSLFPGRFDWSRPLQWWPSFHEVRYLSDVVDVIVNVPFYMPLGFTAVAAWAQRPGWRAILWATLFGTAVSYGVEFTQQFILPRRFSNSRDILFNAIGAALGAWMATWPRLRRIPMRRPLYAFGQSPAGWWLIALWWTWLAFPFYPHLRTIQLERMWEHSTEEFRGIGLSLLVLGAHLAGGVVLAQLARGKRWLMPMLALIALFLMPFIYGLRFSPWRVAATLAGFALARFVAAKWVVSAWALLYLIYYGMPGLAPYDSTWEAAPEAARASWRTPVRDAAGKLFLLSAVIWSWLRSRR